MAQVVVEPVGPDQLDRLRTLFDASRQTRHCWCMAFGTTRWQFARGWYTGGNRRRMMIMAQTGSDPVGVLALVDGEPVGWCACGPATRYVVGPTARSRLLATRDHDGTSAVWLIACLFVRPDRAGDSVIMPMLRGAVALAESRGATAIEAWPLPFGYRNPALAHVGREGAFTRLGFERVGQPAPDCVLMRLHLQPASPTPTTVHP